VIIDIEIDEHINGCGKLTAVTAKSRIAVDIDGNWSVPALEKFKAKLDDLLARELNGCIM